MQRRTILPTADAAPVLTSGSTWAQDSWPQRPIRPIVGDAPGGSSDITAWLISDKLRAALEQPMGVENKPGADGNIGAETVARAAPDGHTLLLTAAQIVIDPSLYTTGRRILQTSPFPP